MTSTSLFELPEVDPNQIGKAATIDQALASLDSALCATLTLTANSLTSPYTIPYAAGDEPAVTKTALRFFKANVTGTISGTWTAYMPVGKQKFFAVANQTSGGHNVIFMVSGQTGVTIPPGYVALCFLNGTDVECEFMGLAAGVVPYDLTGSFTVGANGGGSSGKPPASNLIWKVVVPRQVNFAGNYAGSFAKATTAATGTTAYAISQNGGSTGAITWTGGTDGAFTSPSGNPVQLNAGDILTITTPVSQDATLANIAWCFTGTTP